MRKRQRGRRWPARVGALALIGAGAAFSGLGGCSLGQGEGDVQSELLFARDCWCSTYNLRPDFFSAVPYRNTLQIRVQHGTDLQEVSDGLAVLVDDVAQVRGPLRNKRLKVGLPIGVELPGEGSVDPDTVGTGAPEPLPIGCGPDEPPPLEACPLEELDALNASTEEGEAGGESSEGEPVGGTPLVHMALYLQQSCHNQNIVLYAVKGTIMFRTLFSADPNEAVATEKYTDAIFDVQMGDLQEVPAGAPADEVPEDRQTRLRGCFRFYFERGQPGQPFP